jgi:hypothetical protein
VYRIGFSDDTSGIKEVVIRQRLVSRAQLPNATIYHEYLFSRMLIEAVAIDRNTDGWQGTLLN